MKRLNLKNTDKVSLVDDEDYEFLSKFPWTVDKAGYAVLKISLHRFLMSFPEGKWVDHIDRNPLNNTKQNLRKVTPSEIT